MFDGSMSSVAGNKIRIARRLGAKVAPGWIARPDGTPIMEESEAPTTSSCCRWAAPARSGRTRATAWRWWSTSWPACSPATGPGFLHHSDVSHHFTAWRIDAFRDVEAFKADMDALLPGLRECPPAPGAERVLYAGLPEAETLADRRERGIPYHRTCSSGSAAPAGSAAHPA